jgi:hypothetical protein
VVGGGAMARGVGWIGCPGAWGRCDRWALMSSSVGMVGQAAGWRSAILSSAVRPSPVGQGCGEVGVGVFWIPLGEVASVEQGGF